MDALLAYVIYALLRYLTEKWFYQHHVTWRKNWAWIQLIPSISFP